MEDSDEADEVWNLVAQNIVAKAVEQGREAELLEKLYDNYAVTIDSQTGELLFAKLPDIRDEILENATAIVFEHPDSPIKWSTIRKDYNGKYYATKNLTNKPKDQLQADNLESIEEAYVWIMEGKENENSNM